MKYQQANVIVGYVTIHIKGKHPEHFLKQCATNNITVMNVRKIAQDICMGTIYLHDLKNVKRLIQDTTYELIKIDSPKGLFPTAKKLWSNKVMIVTICLCIIFLFGLANIAWKMEISGVSEETELNIREKLEKEGLYEGAWTFNTLDIDLIQQHVLHEMPELMYIGIRKKGTTYHIDAIEKQQEKRIEDLPNRHLVASKNGEIESIFVKKGVGKVAVNDIVEKGDLLVSGEIEKEAEEEEDKDKNEDDKEQLQKVAAEGEVYANTWYEMDVTSPLTQSESQFSGAAYERHFIDIMDFVLPVWGFKQPYANYVKEEKSHALKIFNYTFPIKLKTKIYYEMTNNIQPGTKEEAKERAINHIESNLKRKAGKNSEVLYYKVLHERLDNGKVKMNLYVSVLEDIAQPKEIH
ncbi:MAG TPA: sporulation protein YqfD [Pseudogracilibacillus sp.]|nr:sporulation protein YqfD [Pseudogracilibacillus sp.]